MKQQAQQREAHLPFCARATLTRACQVQGPHQLVAANMGSTPQQLRAECGLHKQTIYTVFQCMVCSSCLVPQQPVTVLAGPARHTTGTSPRLPTGLLEPCPIRHNIQGAGHDESSMAERNSSRPPQPPHEIAVRVPARPDRQRRHKPLHTSMPAMLRVSRLPSLHSGFCSSAPGKHCCTFLQADCCTRNEKGTKKKETHIYDTRDTRSDSIPERRQRIAEPQTLSTSSRTSPPWACTPVGVVALQWWWDTSEKLRP